MEDLNILFTYYVSEELKILINMKQNSFIPPTSCMELLFLMADWFSFATKSHGWLWSWSDYSKHV